MIKALDKPERALFGLSFGHFILDMYAAILIPLYPFIAERLNINIVTISFVIAIGHSVSSILQPVFGYISDKLNHRIFMFFGLVFVSLFIPLGFISPNAIILALCLVLGMMGNAFYHPQVTTMIKNFYDNDNIKLSKAMGIFLGLGTIGYAFGPYFSTFIIKTFGNENFLYIGSIGLIFSIFLLFFVPKLKQKEAVNKANFIEAIIQILKNKICLFLIIVTIIKAALVMSYGTYIPFLLKKYGFSITQTGFIISVFYIMGGVSMIISSKFEKIIKTKGMILASYLPVLPLVLLFLYSIKQNKILACFLLLIIGFFILFAASTVLACAQRKIPNHSGTISGIIQGFTLAMGSILLIPFGAIGQNFGVEYILILISLIAFICAIFTLTVKFDY